MAAPRDDVLVSTAWLAAHLDDPTVRIVDGTYHLSVLGRDAHAEYQATHIPGAVFFDIDWVADPDHALKHMLPDAATFSERVGALGLGGDAHVIVYDTRGLYSAARVWWMFRVHGYDRVSILDGGFPKWLREQRPTESGAVGVEASPFTAGATRDLVVDAEAVRANIDSRAAGLVDARTPGYFNGTDKSPYPGVRDGHIPGSVSLWYEDLLDPDSKTVLPPEQIRAKFEAVGIDLDRPVICTCGSGVTACILALGLHLIGKDDWRVYDGSWAEWGGRDDLPMET